MDTYEATRIVFSRIQALDPENAAKIMGLILIQDHGEKELIRLAFGPESLLQSLVLKAKKDLGLHQPPPPPSSSSSFNHHHHHLLSRQNSSSRFGLAPPPPLNINSPSWAPPEEEHLSSPAFYGADFAMDEFLQGDQETGWPHHHRRSFSAAADLCLSPDGSGLGWKPCLYYARGFCKNGSSCRFVHGFSDEAAALEQEQQQLMMMRSKSPRLAAAAFPYSPTSSSVSAKCMSYLLQQQQNDR